MTAGGKTYTTAKLCETFQDYSINLPALSSTEKITITSDINGRLYIDRIQIIEGNFAELSINPEHQSVESSATSTTFSVSSNTKWTVSTTSDWAKVSTPSGENNGEVEITFSENTTDKERTADIVVTTEDCSITKTFKLTQNGVGGAGPKTYTLTIRATDFSKVSYADNNKERTTKAFATDGSTIDVTWKSNQIMLQGNLMQWQKSKGSLHNITDLGKIINIQITSTSGTFSKIIGTSLEPTKNVDDGGYFKISVGSDAVGKTEKVVITFEK